jgi:hypothetical protein
MEESEVLLRKLSKDHLVQARNMKVVMEELGTVYESKLSAMLSSREKASPAAEADIMTARSNYELARFDLVAKVNENDRNKKVILTQVTCDIFYTFRTVFSECMRQVQGKEAYFDKIQARALEVSQQMPVLANAWDSVRVRLAGELAGALAAPGSPAGSLSPVNPRNHQGMPPYTAVITTEVLSNSTRNASHFDRRHARDDGGEDNALFMHDIPLALDLTYIYMFIRIPQCTSKGICTATPSGCGSASADGTDCTPTSCTPWPSSQRGGVVPAVGRGVGPIPSTSPSAAR